jgi:histidine triad (HIT) family protein
VYKRQPKKEVDYLFGLDDETLGGLMIFARHVALALEKTVPCKRIGVAVIGLEVPHAHVHLVPLQSIYDIDFSKPKLKLSPEEFSSLADSIRKAMETE